MNDDTQQVVLIKDTSAVVQRQQLGAATSQISFVSQGHCLIIGDTQTALDAGLGLGEHGFTVVCIDASFTRVEKQLTEGGIAVFTVPALSLSGHLGAYQAVVPATSIDASSSLDLGVSVFRETGLFDLVLDLSEKPLLSMRLAPFGYVHAEDAESVTAAVESLRDMHGEFDKPRYFDYNEQVCAHSRSELTGCTQCIDVCTTNAIVSDGEGVSIDPFLCQGCGSCATVCPSGAMSYAYPPVSDAIERSRQTMQDKDADTIVLHTEAVQSEIDALDLHAGVVPMLVEEVSAFGADYWLTLLAGPANHIIVVLDSADDDPNRLALVAQMRWLRPLFEALGVVELPVSIVSANVLEQELSKVTDADSAANGASLRTAAVSVSAATGNFVTHGDKRQTLRMALDALADQLAPEAPFVELPAGAPFGQINVDTEACTLCMACVSTCPAKALQDGQDTPALRFVEANCLQCGLCESACPESAISLNPLYTWDSVEARKLVTLHDEQPFHCARCHTAFTTQAMIDTMISKLAGHWMFQDEKALRRLKLCGDCRVRDMFEEDAAGVAVHKTS